MLHEPDKRRAIRRAKIIAALMPLGSIVLLLGMAAIAGNLGSAAFLARLTSPLVVFLLCLLVSILLPAYLRIYYVVVLNNHGVFTAQERRLYQIRKQHWEWYLLRAALLAGVMLVGLGIWVRWH
jgi:hypothetical protein